MAWGVPTVRLGLTSSRPRLELKGLARDLGLPAERERVVLVSFGGLGMAIDPALFARWPQHVFIGPDPAMASVPMAVACPRGCGPSI